DPRPAGRASPHCVIGTAACPALPYRSGPRTKEASMTVEYIMTCDPECCSPSTSLADVARLMVECDCGEIPVCDDSQKPIGVVTGRAIVCRVVAEAQEQRRLRGGG